MKKWVDKFKENWAKKSKSKKISDVLFWIFILALVVPQTRTMIMGQVNTLKSFVFSPEIIKSEEAVELTNKDYIWKLTKPDGSQIYLSDLKGKVIFINRWATWCGPCVAEMPSIQKLYDKYSSNPNIAFVIVSGETNKTVSSFINNKGFTFPVYTNKYAPPKTFASNSIPATYIISKSGKLVLEEIGAADWSTKNMHDIIDNLLAE